MSLKQFKNDIIFRHSMNSNNLKMVKYMKKQTEITNNQLTFSLVAIVIGSGILSLPKTVAEKGYQDGWIIVLLGSFIPLLSIFSIILLFKRFPGYEFFDICKFLLGKYLGRVLYFLYIVYGLIFGVTSISVFTSVLNTYILPKTPSNVIFILMIAVALYIINGGIKVVARFNELTFYIFLMLLFFIIPSLKQAEPTFLFPVFTTPVMDLLSGSLKTSWSFVGFEYLLILYPFVKNKKKAVSSSLLAFFIIMAVYIYVVIVCNLIFGPYAVKNYLWPVLVLLKVTDILVIERLEFFFILLWVGVAIRPMLNQLFSTTYLISKLFGIKKMVNASIIGALAMFIIQYLSNTTLKSFKLSNFFGTAGLVFGTAIPVLLLLMSFVFNKKVKKIQIQFKIL